MQILGGKSVKLQFLQKKKKILPMKIIVHVICIMTVAEKQQNIFEFKENWSFYKILKIVIFGKLTGGFENFLKTARETNKNVFSGYDR